MGIAVEAEPSATALEGSDPVGFHIGAQVPHGEGQSGESGGHDSFAINVSGWVVSRQGPFAAVELLWEGDLHWRTNSPIRRADTAEMYPQLEHARRSGFNATISALQFPPRFELEVCAVLEDGQRVTLGTVRCSRDTLRTGAIAQFQPLMITTLGRTGSTALARMLGEHPDVLSFKPFRYEPRVATYWIDILRTLTEPSSYRRQISYSGGFDSDVWWAAFRPPQPEPFEDAELERWLGGEGVQSLGAIAQERIEALYHRIAETVGKKQARFFVEKYTPTATPSLLWELYPGARELFLVRDPRDMITSMLAYDRKRGLRHFVSGEDAKDQAASIAESMKVNVSWLARAWNARSDRAMLVRYEDLIREPVQTLERMLGYLDLDAVPSSVEAMLAGLTDGGDTQDHRTTPSALASVGRWRDELGPELQEVCERDLAVAFETFGYSADGRS